MNLNREEEFDKNLHKRKEEAIIELYHTGRYQGLYMGRTSNCKDNPIKAYIGGWMKMKGFKDKAIEQEINDYNNELFKEVHLIKLEKWEELLANPKKLTATICLIAQRHLFRDVNEKYPKAKSYYEKNKLFSTSLDRETQRVNHNEFLDIEGEFIVGDIAIDPFENKYGITCDKFLSLMTEEEKALFYSYLNKKGTGQKGRYTNADKEHYANIYNEISGICNRIKNNLNK